mgnify:FL=1
MNHLIKTQILNIIEYDFCYDMNRFHKAFTKDLEDMFEIINENLINRLVDSNDRFNLKDIVEDFLDEFSCNFNDTIAHPDDIFEVFYEPQIFSNFDNLILTIRNKKLEAFDMVLNHTCYDCYTIIKKFYLEILEEEYEDNFNLELTEYSNEQLEQLQRQKEEPEFDWTEMKFCPSGLMSDIFRIENY